MLFNAATSNYTFIHTPKNRHTYISITKEGSVTVKSPHVSETRIRQMLQEKEGWIQKKLMLMEKRECHTHEWGKTVRFRGALYPIENFFYLHNRIEKRGGVGNIEKHYYDFYRAEAQMSIPGRVRHYAQKLGLYPSEVRFKKMRRRWGSCDSNGVVTFNTLIMQLSYEHIDYVIVHELAHLRHMNHSSVFHRLVGTILANEKELRSELKGIFPVL